MFVALYSCLRPVFIRSDALGGGVVLGDNRWAGSYGIDADILARTHCSVEIISIEDLQVPSFCALEC